MLLFGLGTVPALAAVGMGGGLLSLPLRRRVFTLAAWCVVLTGAISVGRGIAFLDPISPVCPGCP